MSQQPQWITDLDDATAEAVARILRGDPPPPCEHRYCHDQGYAMCMGVAGAQVDMLENSGLSREEHLIDHIPTGEWREPDVYFNDETGEYADHSFTRRLMAWALVDTFASRSLTCYVPAHQFRRLQGSCGHHQCFACASRRKRSSTTNHRRPLTAGYRTVTDDENAPISSATRRG